MRVIVTVEGHTEIFGGWNGQQNAIKDNFQALPKGKENFSKGVVVKTTEAGTIAVDVYTVLEAMEQRLRSLKKYSRTCEI